MLAGILMQTRGYEVRPNRASKYDLGADSHQAPCDRHLRVKFDGRLSRSSTARSAGAQRAYKLVDYGQLEVSSATGSTSKLQPIVRLRLVLITAAETTMTTVQPAQPPSGSLQTSWRTRGYRVCLYTTSE